MVNEISDDAVVTRVDNVLSTDLGGELVMMHLESGSYFSLRETGFRIWELIETPRPVADIVQTMSSEYDVDADTCAADVRGFIAEMQDAGIVTVA